MSTYRLDSSLEWLNSNMHRNYPLVDSMVVRSIAGEYLPSSFLVDMQLIIPYVDGVDPARFFISSIIRNANSFQVVIGYMTVDPGPNVARQGFDCAVSAAIPDTLIAGSSYDDNDHVINISAITTEQTQVDASYSYGIPDAYAAFRGLHGILYIGSCADMANINVLRFNYENSAIMQTCVYIEGKNEQLNSIRLVDSYGTDATFTDDTTLILGTGIQATIEGSTVTLSMYDDFVLNKINTMLSAAIGNAIKTINGQPPDPTGDFTIYPLDCTAIDQAENGITISNPCSQPCCDATGADTAEIATALAELTAAKEVLNNYYTDLATKVNMMQARLSSLIASRK